MSSRRPSTSGHGHSHGSTGTATGRHRRRLVIVICITASVMAFQAVGAWLSGSLALLADAGHMLTDTAGLLIALLAATLAMRPSTDQRTFGWQRAEVLAALGNALILTVVGVLVIREAFLRWGAEPDIDADLMLGVAVIGAAANAVSMVILFRSSGESLNMRGAYLEVLGDFLGSLAVIVAAIVVLTTGWARADAVASFAIGLMILPRAFSLLRDVAHVLMEAAPKGVDLGAVRTHLLAVPGVIGVHDLHAWTITSGVPVLSAHIVVDNERVDCGIECQTLDRLRACLEGHFDVDHCTFQLETLSHSEHEPATHA
ncbi:MAG: cation diffusion facilitator family transporter [Ornithinimicrobium sp.]